MNIEDLRIYHSYELGGKDYELVRMGTPVLEDEETRTELLLDLEHLGPLVHWGTAVLRRASGHYQGSIVTVPLETFAQYAIPLAANKP